MSNKLKVGFLPDIREIAPPKTAQHCRAFYCKKKKIVILVGLELGGWHLSISAKSRYPHWNEIKEARYKFIPNEITMAMMLPPKEEYVNVHQNTFHLYEIKVDNGGKNEQDTNLGISELSKLLNASEQNK